MAGVYKNLHLEGNNIWGTCITKDKIPKELFNLEYFYHCKLIWLDIIAEENIFEWKVENAPTFRGSKFVRWKITNRNHLFFMKSNDNK